MTWKGVGNLHLIEGNMDKYVYCEILEMELMNTIHMHDLGKKNVISNTTMTPNLLLSILQSSCWHRSFNSLGIRLNHLA